MTVRQVTSDAEFAAALALSTGTDTVELANGATFGTLIVPSTTADGVTITSQSKWGCTAARFRLQAVEGVSLHDTYIQSVETDFTTEPAPLIDFNSPLMDGFVMMGCKVRHGNHLAGFANFDTSNAGEQYAAQIGSGATATWPVPNVFGRWSATYTTGIMDAVKPTNGALSGSLHIEDCEFLDNSYIMQLTHNGGKEIKIRKNLFARSYGDVILIGFPGQFAPIPLLDISGNILYDCAWCQPQDARNPHGDAIQINSADTRGTKLTLTGITGTFNAGDTVTRGAVVGTIGWKPDANNIVVPSLAWTTGAITSSSGGSATVSVVTSNFSPGPTDSRTPIENVVIAGNLIACSPGYRGEIQRVFLSDVPLGYPFIGATVVDNVMISRITNKGGTISNGASTVSLPGNLGSATAMMFRNTFLARPDQNLPKQNELYTNPNTAISAANPSPATISITADDYYPALNFVGRNISESISVTSSLDLAVQPNITTGLANDGSDYGTYFDIPANWNAVVTAEDVFNAFKPKPAYADYGGARPGQTLTEFLDKWSTDAKPYTELPSYVGLRDKKNQAFGAVVTSDRSFVHAGRTSRAISVGPGVEYALYADNFTAVPTVDWTSAPGTVTHGQFLAVRRTAAASSAITLISSIQIGSETFLWRVTTIDTTVYPRVSFNATQIIRQTAAQAWAAAESGLFTFAMEFNMAANPGATMNFFGESVGSPRLELGVLATGKFRARLINNAAAQIVRMDSTTTITGGWHRVIFTVDTSQATVTDGTYLSVDGGLNEATNFGSWTVGSQIDFDIASASHQIGGGLSTPTLVSEFAFAWFGAGQWIDLNDATNREKFSASNIGPGGEGPTGTPPRVFLVGPQATWNSGNPNKGSGTSWSKAAGNGVDVGAVNAEVWPPVLNLASAVQDLAPFYVGQPIDILVQASGYPKAINVTGASDKAGTWAANPMNMPLGSNGIVFTFTPTIDGDHTVTFTNDGGYNAPTALVFNVETFVPPVLEDGIKRAIKHGIKRTIKRSMRDWS